MTSEGYADINYPTTLLAKVAFGEPVFYGVLSQVFTLVELRDAVNKAMSVKSRAIVPAENSRFFKDTYRVLGICKIKGNSKRHHAGHANFIFFMANLSAALSYDGVFAAAAHRGRPTRV